MMASLEAVQAKAIDLGSELTLDLNNLLNLQMKAVNPKNKARLDVEIQDVQQRLTLLKVALII